MPRKHFTRPTKKFKIRWLDRRDGLPWDMVEPHREQAWKNLGKSLEELNAGEGLDWIEMIAVLEDVPRYIIWENHAMNAVLAKVNEWLANAGKRKIEVKARVMQNLEMRVLALNRAIVEVEKKGYWVELELTGEGEGGACMVKVDVTEKGETES